MAQLGLLFCDGDLAQQRIDTDGMSLLEKMKLWNNNFRQTEGSADQIDVFQEVEDANVKDIRLEPSTYNKTIIRSSAFHWLVGSMKRRLSLQWPQAGMQDLTTVDDIHNSILSKLPAGNINKNELPSTHEVTFRLPWQNLNKRLGQERLKLNTSLKEVIRRSLVVTSCLKELQATSVEQYMRKIWPKSWKEFIELIAHEYSGMGNDYKGTLL